MVKKVTRLIVTENKGSGMVTIGQKIIKIDKRYYRPSEVDTLQGDPSKTKLHWIPSYNFDSIVEEMVEADLEKFKPSE